MPTLPFTTSTPAQGVSRRTIAKGAAWSIPAIIMASPAPAIASSQCESSTTEWPAEGAGVITSNGISVSAVALGRTHQRLGNMTVARPQFALPNTQNNAFTTAIFLWQTKDNSKGQRITLTIPAGVTCAKFYLSNIDSGRDLGQYRDVVEFDTPGVTMRAVQEDGSDRLVIDNSKQIAMQDNSVTPNKGDSSYPIFKSPRGTVECTWSTENPDQPHTIVFRYYNGLKPLSPNNVNANSMMLLISNITTQSGNNCSC
ncbi:hypothetical protein [Actinomyces vulturis]|uniref:hypothetical protein n=1 Tax=Actinomyces vulturis TaxID=1857645 RepID=UPI0008366DEE|nr:hypothetical protein [Actinomyces vulturis]